MVEAKRFPSSENSGRSSCGTTSEQRHRCYAAIHALHENLFAEKQTTPVLKPQAIHASNAIAISAMPPFSAPRPLAFAVYAPCAPMPNRAPHASADHTAHRKRCGSPPTFLIARFGMAS